jgi:hypothetical protein
MTGTRILDLVVKGETSEMEIDFESLNISSYSSLELWQLKYLQSEVPENQKIIT